MAYAIQSGTKEQTYSALSPKVENITRPLLMFTEKKSNSNTLDTDPLGSEESKKLYTQVRGYQAPSEKAKERLTGSDGMVVIIDASKKTKNVVKKFNVNLELDETVTNNDAVPSHKTLSAALLSHKMVTQLQKSQRNSLKTK